MQGWEILYRLAWVPAFAGMTAPVISAQAEFHAGLGFSVCWRGFPPSRE